MKVLIIAPRICSPWTEGRKKFVRDLIEATTGRWQISGLVTVDAGESTDLPRRFRTLTANSKKDHVTLLLAKLKQAVTAHNPDLVLHFPFGAFGGLRGLANLWAIRRTSAVCRHLGVPSMTLMYSLTEEANTALYRYFLKDVYTNQYSQGDNVIRFGVKLPPAILPEQSRTDSQTLLFMAGAAEATAERLGYVLDDRGLRQLLRIGDTLAAAGFRLVVAIPLLKSAAMTRRLVSLADNTWPENRLVLRGKVTVPEVFADADAFVFPYGQEEKLFVPTSVVEAMHFLTPVILPNLSFLAPFWHSPQGEAKVLAYQQGNPEDLAAQILRLKSEPENIINMRDKAAAWVDAEYDINNSAQDIEAAYRRLRDSRKG